VFELDVYKYDGREKINDDDERDLKNEAVKFAIVERALTSFPFLII